VIYSRWRPDTGGYDYFQDELTHNLNDDLPEPQLHAASQIGVPSIEAGRAIPRGAEWVGEGPTAVGLVAPVDSRSLVRRTRALGPLSGLPSPGGPGFWIAAAIGTAAVGFIMWKRKRT